MISERSEVAIRVFDLKKSYGGNIAVDGISFEIPKGIVFSLIGPNGAGKTTTISVLEGVLRRDSGRVEILGVDPWTNHNELKVRMGVLPQEFNFFEKLTALEAVRFYCSLFNSPLDPMSILKIVSLEDSINVRFENLSGGQKQKVGLALALVNDPEILFLDEPTTGLDPISRRAIWETISRFKQQGRTVILTTHYMEEAERLSDIVAIIKQGKLIAVGSPADLESTNSSGRKITLRADKNLADYLTGQGVNMQYKDGTILISLEEGGSLSRIVALVEDSDLKFTRLSVRDDNLEDVYLRLVGNSEEVETA